MVAYSTNLRLTLQDTGENPNTWGQVANGVFEKIEAAISGMYTVNVTTGTDITLTTTNGSADQASNMILNLSGEPINNINVIVPDVTKVYVVDATNVDGDFSVTIKTNAGNGVGFNSGDTKVIYCDGTDVKIIAESTPSGVISLWSGSIATIPGGYQLCDGSNGTPDLRNKFVISAHSDSGGSAQTTITGSSTIIGGSKDISSTTGSGGDHNHGGAAGETVLSLNHIPDYNILIPRRALGGLSSGTDSNRLSLGDPSGSSGTFSVSSRGSGDPHDHSISNSGSHTHSISITNGSLPPYYALAYIMKV